MEDNILDDIRKEDEVSAETEDTQRKILYGKNGHRLATSPLAEKRIKNAQEKYSFTRRISQENYHLHKSRNKQTKNEILFITDELVKKITICTNQEINRQKMKYKTQQFYRKPTNATQLQALFGILYLSGVLKDAHLTIKDMWSRLGPPQFRGTMSKNRFEFLNNCLRFDQKTTRQEKRIADKFAAIRLLPLQLPSFGIRHNR
ncbi:Transposase IS4 [Popillia japonica]|uniref:Transposase IS4 n=1 Tax=Popillia japonica TaxID=7064 RepID=A0AAW1NFU3_POPJA